MIAIACLAVGLVYVTRIHYHWVYFGQSIYRKCVWSREMAVILPTSTRKQF